MADDPTINWQLANPFGIQMNEEIDAWNSGHVNDVLELDSGDVLVATQTGGVWIVISATGQVQPLSNSWENPDVNCLAQGPYGDRHFFCGCTNGIIRETDFSANVPLLEWNEVSNALPSKAGAVHRIVVVKNLRRIVVACDGGLFWSMIPEPAQPGSLRAAFNWKAGKIEDNGQKGFWDVAIGSTRAHVAKSELEDKRSITVVAAGFYRGGIFVGGWDSADNLKLMKARLFFDDGKEATFIFKIVGTTSVSSCEIRPTVLYSVCAKPDGLLDFVSSSSDGGQSWTMCKMEVPKPSPTILFFATGDQGADWNNRIAVAPTDPGMLAVGWKAGTFLSLDSGQNWLKIEEDNHLHDDVHALLFTPNTPGSIHYLYIGSDGGLAQVNLDDYLGLTGQPFRSNYNRLLTTLQCNGTQGKHSMRFPMLYGTLTASAQQDGLLLAGVQDNGNIYCQAGPSPTPWLELDGGDGFWNAFLNDDQLGLVHNINEYAAGAARISGPQKLTDLGVVPVGQPPTDPAGIREPVGEIVQHPSYRNAAGQKLLAVAGKNNRVFGLYPNLDGGGLYHWEVLGSVPKELKVSALCSFHGGSVHVAASGRMFVIDTASGSILELPVELPKPSPTSTPKPGNINRIVAFNESSVFASMNASTVTITKISIVGGVIRFLTITITNFYVLRLDGLHWVVTPSSGLFNQEIYGLEAVEVPQSRVPHALFVATDDRVYISRDDGLTWQQASKSLPRNPHCSDLRFVRTRNAATLYLGTYGRSVWQATIHEAD